MGAILEKLLEKLIGILTGVMVLLLIAQVTTRYIFQGSMYWAGEMATWVFVWITFLGTALLYRQKGHTIVDLVDYMFPEQVRKGLEVFVNIVVAVFLGVLFYYALPVVKSYSNQYATSIHLSRGLMFLPLPVSIVFIFLFMLDSILQKIGVK